MNRTTLKAYSQAIAAAGLNRTAAYHVEIAVGFAVMLETGNARIARAALCDIYASAGYKATKPGDYDWRKVNRHITASLALFDFIGGEEIAEWAAGKQRKELIDAFVAKLQPYKVKTVNEILEVCGKLGVKPRQRGASGAHDAPGTHHVTTAHCKITIPPDATRAELLEIAMAIMKIAETAPINGDDIEEVETDTVAEPETAEA